MTARGIKATKMRVPTMPPMETFVVRVFVADDMDAFVGTVERPGEPSRTFHDAKELIGFLHEALAAGATLEGDATRLIQSVADPPSA